MGGSVRLGLRSLRRSLGIKSSRTRALKALPPDFDDGKIRIVRDVYEYTMTSPERIGALVDAVRYVVANGIEGDFVECGVWRGGSSMATALALRELGDESRHLYLYDTFEGMSQPTDVDVSFDAKSAAETFRQRQIAPDASEWCRSSLDEVEANMRRTRYARERMHFVKGKIEDTLPSQAPRGALAILRLDTDWYESTRHELEQLYPRLVSGGVLIIDDYGFWKGSRKAVDEYVERHSLRLLLNRIDFTGRIAVKP